MQNTLLEALDAFTVNASQFDDIRLLIALRED
jgi:hypothetical protein